MSNVYNTNVNLIKQLRDRTSLGLADCKKALEQSNNNIESAIDLLKQWGELKGKEKENKVATEGLIRYYSNNSGSIKGIVEINCQSDFVAKSDAFGDFVNTVCMTLQKKGAYEFESKRKELIAKTGENIVVRRHETWTGFSPFSIRYVYPHGDNLASMVEVSISNEKLTNNPEFSEFVSDIALQVAAMSPIVVSKKDLSADLIDRQQKIFEAQLTEDKKPVQAWPKIIEGKFSKWRKDIVLLEQESIKVPGKTVNQILEDLSKKLGASITVNRFVRYALGEGLVKAQDDLADEVSKLINSSGDK
jgi:elongation factor Ts